MKKSKWSLLAMLFALVLVLAACGKGEEDGQQGKAADQGLSKDAEFASKVFEEELTRNYIKKDCLYPMVDFQQKYMIANALKEQPSLGGLMQQLGLENETQHRALADAVSLLRIFQEVDGEKLIEAQQTNEFILLLTNFRMLETTYELVISATNCSVHEGQIHIKDMQTFREELPFTIQNIERVGEDGEVKVVEHIQIKPSEQAKRNEKRQERKSYFFNPCLLYFNCIFLNQRTLIKFV